MEVNKMMSTESHKQLTFSTDFKQCGALVGDPLKESEMVYKENLVAVVKCGGRILREFDGLVSLPFGSEYSLLIKNLDSRKVLVNISIDGKSAANGILIDGNRDMELDGFLEGMDVRNRFRFIQKTQEIVDHRGDHVDDGMVRVEFWHEKRVEKVDVHHKNVYDPPRWFRPHNYPWEYPFYGGVTNTPVTSETRTFVSGVQSTTGVDLLSPSFSCNFTQTPAVDEGITVKGSEVHQQFQYGSIGQIEDQSKVIVIRLRGFRYGNKVDFPITVKDKLTCKTCGRKSDYGYKYCSGCGTFLE